MIVSKCLYARVLVEVLAGWNGEELHTKKQNFRLESDKQRRK